MLGFVTNDPREEKQAHGEIETEHPGYLGAPRTPTRGHTIKSIGLIGDGSRALS